MERVDAQNPLIREEIFVAKIFAPDAHRDAAEVSFFLIGKPRFVGETSSDGLREFRFEKLETRIRNVVRRADQKSHEALFKLLASSFNLRIVDHFFNGLARKAGSIFRRPADFLFRLPARCRSSTARSSACSIGTFES